MRNDRTPSRYVGYGQDDDTAAGGLLDWLAGLLALPLLWVLAVLLIAVFGV
jgi:hypothetical protein